MKLFFLLVSLAYANASISDRVEHSLLRGSTQGQQEQGQQEQKLIATRNSRSLLDLNEMECRPDNISNDGSIICSFRMFPPTSPNVGTIKHACTFVPAPFSRSMCISAEINRVNFNDLPENHFNGDGDGIPSASLDGIDDPVAVMPAEPAVMPAEPVVVVITPSEPAVMPSEPVVVMPSEPVVVMPSEPVVVMPVNPATGTGTGGTVFINAEVSEVVLPPAAGAAVAASQSESPPLPGRDDCPSEKPENLSGCDIDNGRCSYYDNIIEPQAAGITNCDCTKDEGFRCRPATDFAFSF